MIFLNKKFSKYHDVRLGFMNFECVCNEYSYNKTKITFTNVMVTNETNTIKKDWYLFIEIEVLFVTKNQMKWVEIISNLLIYINATGMFNELN